MYILEFLEIEKEVIWGGDNLVKNYSKPFDINKKIGESWEIADLPNDKSIVSNGDFKGETLNSLISKYGKDLLGSNCSIFIEENYFPLLIKLIDAKDKLSIQVHPDEVYAKKRHNKHGKNEMWYVMEACENAKLLIGLKENISSSQLKEAIDNKNNIEDMFNYIDVKKGDAFYIPNGCIHAILGDVLISEIQTPSDVTYRLYDWNRVDSSGMSRELHIEDSFNVIKDIDAFTLKSNRKVKVSEENLEIREIFNTEYFKTDEYLINNSFSSNTTTSSFEIIIILEGVGKIECASNTVDIYSGKTVFLPALLGNYSIKCNGVMKFLRVTV